MLDSIELIKASNSGNPVKMFESNFEKGE